VKKTGDMGGGEDGHHSSIVESAQTITEFLKDAFAAGSHDLSTKTLSMCTYHKSVSVQNVDV